VLKSLAEHLHEPLSQQAEGTKSSSQDWTGDKILWVKQPQQERLYYSLVQFHAEKKTPHRMTKAYTSATCARSSIL